MKDVAVIGVHEKTFARPAHNRRQREPAIDEARNPSHSSGLSGMGVHDVRPLTQHQPE